MTPARKLLLKKIFAHSLLIAFIVIILSPFAMVVAASFRKGNFAPSKIFLTPQELSLEHWKFVLGIPYQEVVNPTTGETRTIQAGSPPLGWFWNSIKVSGAATIGIILLSGTAAYAFSRIRFKFRRRLLTGLLILQMFPAVLMLVAYHTILDDIGQTARWIGLNTHPGLVLVYLGGISTNIWMIKGYFDTIPASMEESARIDGASHFQAFLRVLLPMSLPIFAVVFILSFIFFMTEYPIASVVLTNTDTYTLAVGANSFLGEQEKLWGRFAALAVLSGVPITVVFLLCQKFVIGGLISGGVKE
jgi:maltose/maltodextrin transport system permease protein